MSLKTLKSGAIKCIYCDISFKTKESAAKHLKTPGHKARKESATSKLNSSTRSSLSKSPKTTKSSLKVKATIKSPKPASRSILRDTSILSKPPKSPKSTKSARTKDSIIEDSYMEDQTFQESVVSETSDNSVRFNTGNSDLIIAKLDQIIEKQNLLELRIQNFESKFEHSNRDKQRQLVQAIDNDPVINENLQEIKRIEAAEKIIQERLGMLSRSQRNDGYSSQRPKSSGNLKRSCEVCGSSSGW
ncbi:hypothetical protein SS50377_28590 [Spironucleus salmonicida]|uniref:C2H2-type domain-containing protein n=1 Tax=Spironucleus salmonicida TaxID=348837 RepID=V6LAZ5_9EUKA|nr:hypothetical protein SS50377_28590 [Spironucleus salmonicida]|eukprot:EST41587.1 Hypothetical protein SS50377_18928 [Spironucleus salmonicida]